MHVLPTLPKSLRGGLLLASVVICQGHTSAAETKWEQAGWGGGGFFWAAEYHPTKKGTMYLGGDVAGIYRTDDHGKQWKMINNGLVSYAVYSVAVDRTNPDTVYAITEDGVSKSTNAGESWKTLPNTGKKELRITAERNKSVRALAMDPANGNNLYAASPGGKIYKSVDGGETWTVSWTKEAEAAGDSLRVQYGKVNAEYFGDIAIPVTVPATANTSETFRSRLHGEGRRIDCEGFLFHGADEVRRHLPEQEPGPALQKHRVAGHRHGVGGFHRRAGLCEEEPRSGGEKPHPGLGGDRPLRSRDFRQPARGADGAGTEGIFLHQRSGGQAGEGDHP